MTAQRQIAAFVSGIDPQWARAGHETAALAVCDTLAVAFAGSASSAVLKTTEWARTRPSPDGSATVWLTQERTDCETAALLNAVAAHALDYDDVTPAWRGHPSAVIVPALSAVSSRAEVAGRSLLDAYVVGFEVGAALGTAIVDTHYPAGWHSTATIGVLAATAACCRFLALPEAVSSHALGLAAAQAGGTQANFGTEAKPLQAGFAAAAAVRATLLAEAGVQAGSGMLDGPAGFVSLYGRKGAEPLLLAAADRLGTVDPSLVGRIEMKLFPTCYAAHRAMLAACALRADPAFAFGDLTAISVTGSAGSHVPLISHPPRNADEAKFHLPTLVAMLLVDGEVGLTSFARARHEAPAIRDLARRVTVAEEAGPSPGRWSRLRAQVGGRDWVGEVARLPDVGWDTPAWHAKIRDCVTEDGRGQRSRMVALAARLADAASAHRLQAVLLA